MGGFSPFMVSGDANQQFEQALRIAEANRDEQGFELRSRHSNLGNVL